MSGHTQRIWALLAFFLFAFTSVSWSQSGLIVNEVSNGPTGSQEYIELLVIGPPCSNVDISNWIVDDNNGDFGAGGGNGIANGHIRFRNIPVWQNVPAGSIILLYNGADKNTNIVQADDPADANNDQVYILATSSTIIEFCVGAPINSNPNYACPGVYNFASLISWNGIGLRNSGDAAQVRMPNGAYFHGISWGANPGGPDNLNVAVGSGSGKNYFFINGQYTNVANFGDGAATLNETPGSPNSPANFLYIDSIQNQAITGGLFLGNDTTICQGNTVTLDAGASGGYLWSTSATTQTISVTTTGTYFVEAGPAGCLLKDTITVTVNTIPGPNLRPDTTLCPGDTIVLTADSGFVTYSWSTGSAAQAILALQADTFFISVTDTVGCIATDSVIIGPINPSVLDLGSDTTICLGDLFVLDAGATTGSYLWSSGATTQTISTDTAGTFFVESGPSTCLQFDTITVSVDTIVPVFLGNDTTLCDGTNLLIDAGASFTTYAWSNSTAFSSVLVSTPNTYQVTVTNSFGCTASDTIIIAYSNTPVLNLGADSSICPLDSLVLDPGLGFVSWNWSTGDTTPTVTINSTNFVSVTATDPFGCTATDQINIIQITNIPVSLGNDTGFCPAGGVVLTPGPGYAFYVWNTTEITASITVITAGQYAVTASNATGCFGIDTVNVIQTVPLVPQLGPDTMLCDVNPYVLNTGWPGTYLWQDGSTNSFFNVASTGLYWVELTANGCVARDSVNIISNNSPVFDLGPNVSICNIFPVTLDPGIGGAATFVWSTTETTPTILVNTSATYSVTITENGCSAIDSKTITFSAPPIVDLGPDTILCNLPFFTIHAGGPFDSYLWSTGGNGPFEGIPTTGQYWAEVSLGGCTDRDTINITFNPIPIVNLGADTVICGQIPQLLNPGNLGNYVWSTGDSTPTLLANSTGFYDVSVTLNGCTGSDQIYIDFFDHPGIDLGDDEVVCNDLAFPLDGGVADSVVWFNGSTDSNIFVFQSGTYTITGWLNSCQAFDTITLKFQTTPDSLDWVDQVLCPGEHLILDAGVNGGKAIFSWNTGSTDPLIVATEPGNYWVQMDNECGQVFQEITLEHSDCFSTLWIPNAFTPDDDQINDVWQIKGTNIKTIKTQLFNRWGELIWETTSMEETWDGKTNGQLVPLGVYVYRVRAIGDFGENHYEVGTVTVIR